MARNKKQQPPLHPPPLLPLKHLPLLPPTPLLQHLLLLLPRLLLPSDRVFCHGGPMGLPRPHQNTRQLAGFLMLGTSRSAQFGGQKFEDPVGVFGRFGPSFLAEHIELDLFATHRPQLDLIAHQAG